MEQSTQTARRRFSAEERANYIELYRQSGLTQRAFAKQQGLNLGTFHQWLHRTKADPRERAVGFKEIVLPGASAGWSVEVVLGQEVIRLGACASPEFIAQLVKSLRRPC